MATPVLWKNVQVSIQTALGSEKTISAISKASPAIITSAAHGFSDDAFVLLDVEGMYQLDARAFRIDTGVSSPSDPNSFALESEDSTLYETFTSGTAQLITFGVNMQTAVGIAGEGGDFDMVDYTTIHDNFRKEIPGLPNAIRYTFDNIWDLNDPALLELRRASNLQQERAVRFSYPAGQVVVFSGFIGCTLLPIGEAQGLVRTSCVVTMNNVPSMYAAP